MNVLIPFACGTPNLYLGGAWCASKIESQLGPHRDGWLLDSPADKKWFSGGGAHSTGLIKAGQVGRAFGQSGPIKLHFSLKQAFKDRLY